MMNEKYEFLLIGSSCCITFGLTTLLILYIGEYLGKVPGTFSGIVIITIGLYLTYLAAKERVKEAENEKI